jgi:hypothetical protein
MRKRKPRGVGSMKVSVIPWHVFFEACEREKSGTLGQWLQRWVFADDGVRVSPEQSVQKGYDQQNAHTGRKLRPWT